MRRQTRHFICEAFSGCRLGRGQVRRWTYVIGHDSPIVPSTAPRVSMALGRPPKSPPPAFGGARVVFPAALLVEMLSRARSIAYNTGLSPMVARKHAGDVACDVVIRRRSQEVRSARRGFFPGQRALRAHQVQKDRHDAPTIAVLGSPSKKPRGIQSPKRSAALAII